MVLGFQSDGVWGPATHPGPHDSTDMTRPYSRQHFRHFGMFPDITSLCPPDYNAGCVSGSVNRGRNRLRWMTWPVEGLVHQLGLGDSGHSEVLGSGLWPQSAQVALLANTEEERSHLKVQSLRPLNPDSSGELTLPGQSAPEINQGGYAQTSSASGSALPQEQQWRKCSTRVEERRGARRLKFKS